MPSDHYLRTKAIDEIQAKLPKGYEAPADHYHSKSGEKAIHKSAIQKLFNQETEDK